MDTLTCSPVGHLYGEQSVCGDRCGGHHRILGTQVVCEQTAYEQHLQRGGEHIEEHGGQCEVDGPGAAVDGPRKRACVTVQMELQVQLVQVLEDIARNLIQ